MTVEVVPKIEYICVLSDGTKLVRDSKEAIILHIKTKMRGNSNVLSHYAHEIERLNQEFDLLQRDLEAAQAIKD